MQLCQSCEEQPVTVMEPCDAPATPYELCKPCHARLVDFSLRPSEWYNLSKRFGWWQFLLHDDFYDETGEASQPEDDVEDPELFPIPSLEEVSNDASLLLDYTITRWGISADVATSWELLRKDAVLETLERRFSSATNTGIRAVTLEVAAIALGIAAANFVRTVWNCHLDQVDLHSLIKASASCLPHPEGYSRSMNAIEVLPQKDQRRAMLSLCHFHAPATLDWIEKSINAPATDDWGYLAAGSGLTWSRVVYWLQSGRPLSLVAIDALATFVKSRSPASRMPQPQLLEPPTASELELALIRYARDDNVPRVQQRVDFILSHSQKLLGGSPSN